MESEKAAAQPHAQSLHDLLARLRNQEVVRGVLLMGTTGTAALTPTSDYDLLLVFAALPVPLRIVTTWVGGRLTEAYCTTKEAVDRVVATPAKWHDTSEEGALVAWLRDGRIVYDPDQHLAAAQERACQAAPPRTATDSEIYEARRKIAYNVAQLKRYLAADDPASGVVVDLRLLYSVFEVVLHYFTVRRLPWRGEKAAARYWSEHDPNFLDLLRQCLASPDPRHKAELYEALARRALAPVGGLWRDEEPIIAIGAAWGSGAEMEPSGTVADALSVWQELLADDQRERGRHATS